MICLDRRQKMFVQVMEKEEREKFLELIYKIANIDGDYAAEEEELIDSYKAELELSDIKDTDTIEEIIDYFSSKSESIRKIVLFEMYGMINSDGKIDISEEKIFNLSQEKFGISEQQTKAIINVAEELQEVYDKVYDVLF